MKKAFIISMVIALSLSMSLPALANGNEIVVTSLNQVNEGGSAPIVKAKWEMNPDKDYNGKYLDGDDSTNQGAQFYPSGQKDVNKTIAICAIVTDPNGVADVAGVYADVYYPVGISLGTSHTPLPNQSGDGCGKFMQEDALTKLSKADGYELFCNKIRNNNNNLPTFNPAYDYDEICAQDGELMKETAYVYCGEKDLSYEDPSGDYKVVAIAQDANSLTGTLDNAFTYLPLTAFDVDFSSVNYGNVKLNTHKKISGDLTWGNGVPTVRNTGNTRMSLTVWQNDMGLGKTSGYWNVQYDGRVGSNSIFADYDPEVTTVLDDELDLSEMDEVDFSILVKKFPIEHDPTWIGTMVLGAQTENHLECIQE